MTFSEQTERALKNYAASADVIREASAFWEGNQSAINRTLKAYQAAQASGAVGEALRFLDSRMAGVQKALRDAGGVMSLERTFHSVSESLAGMDAIMNTGAYQSLREWSFNEPAVQAAAASATAAALVGVAEESLTVEALDDRITEAAAAVTVSYDHLLPEVSVGDAVRFAVWMVVAPTLLILWDDPLIGPWLQAQIELLVVLVALTAWGLKGVVKY